MAVYLKPSLDSKQAKTKPPHARMHVYFTLRLLYRSGRNRVLVRVVAIAYQHARSRETQKTINKAINKLMGELQCAKKYFQQYSIPS
jgi:hypothetical protein